MIYFFKKITMDVTAVAVVAVYVFISIYPDYFSAKLSVSHNIA